MTSALRRPSINLPFSPISKPSMVVSSNTSVSLATSTGTFIAEGFGAHNSHIVQRGFLTPEGPIVIIRDTMKPKPHVFSLSKAFHLEHTGGGEHGWTQKEVDRIISAGGQGETPTEDEDGAPDVPETEGAAV